MITTKLLLLRFNKACEYLRLGVMLLLSFQTVYSYQLVLWKRGKNIRTCSFLIVISIKEPMVFKSLPNFQIYGFYFKNPIHFPWLIIIYLTDFLPQNFLQHKLTIADSLYDGNNSKIISNFNFSKSLNKTQGFIPSKRWLIFKLLPDCAQPAKLYFLTRTDKL